MYCRLFVCLYFVSFPRLYQKLSRLCVVSDLSCSDVTCVCEEGSNFFTTYFKLLHFIYLIGISCRFVNLVLLLDLRTQHTMGSVDGSEEVHYLYRFQNFNHNQLLNASLQNCLEPAKIEIRTQVDDGIWVVMTNDVMSNIKYFS